jgi:tetratricopeptide (TPR) repeat protein
VAGLRRRAIARRRPAQAGRPAEALTVIEACRGLVDGDATAEQRGHFWADYAYVLNAARRLRDTAFALQQAIDNAQALGDIAELATLTSNLATVKGNLGQVPDALALALRSLALQAQLGTTGGPEGAVVETYAGLYCGMVGRYEEALQRLDAALACFVRDRQAMWIAVASNHKAQLLIDLGQFARARQALEYERPSIDHVRARRATVAARVERALGTAAMRCSPRPSASSGRAPTRMCACTSSSTAPTAAIPPPACSAATRCCRWRSRSSSPASR